MLGYEAYLRNIKRIKCRNIEINTGGLYDALDLFEETKPLKVRILVHLRNIVPICGI